MYVNIIKLMFLLEKRIIFFYKRDVGLYILLSSVLFED